MARAGSGNFYFIREASLIPDFIAQELGESLTIVSRRPSLHVEVEADVSVKPSSDFPARRIGPGHLEVPLPDDLERLRRDLVAQAEAKAAERLARAERGGKPPEA